VKEGGRPRRAERFPIRVWLEVDLEAQPIEGTLGPPHGPPTTFIGWVGLTAALEGLRPARESPIVDGGPSGTNSKVRRAHPGQRGGRGPGRLPIEQPPEGSR
jgi:hypothetical protein